MREVGFNPAGVDLKGDGIPPGGRRAQASGLVIVALVFVLITFIEIKRVHKILKGR